MTPAALWSDNIFRAYYPMALQIARSHLGQEFYNHAEDVVQNVFLDLLKKSELLMNHPNIAGWICDAVVYEAKDEMKKAYHKIETELPADYDSIAPESESLLQRKERFYDFLPKELSKEDKQILYCSFELQLSHEEIGRIIHCSASLSRLRLLRAKKHCKKLWENKRKNFNLEKHFPNPNLYIDEEVQR